MSNVCFRSFYVTKKWIKNPPKVSQSPPPTKHQISSPSQHVQPAGTNAPLKVDYTSVYQNDFQAWKAERRQPFKLKDNLNVSLGFSPTGNTSTAEPKHASVNAKSAQQKQERKAFDGISTYRSDYVAHPVQPRQRRANPAHQTSKRQPVESPRPKETCATNQEIHDRANEFFEQFKSWSLETKHQGQTTESNLPAEHKFQSTTHADSLAPQRQGTNSASLSKQTSERSTEPLQATVSMKECCRAWDRPQRLTGPLDWPMKTTFSGAQPKSVETSQTSSNLHPTVAENAVFKCSWKETQRHQPPAEKGGFSPFQCTASMCWSSPLDRGLAWFLAEVKAS
ncbi:uncharacterized protein LOC142368678 [Odontesthes bonariensis]|uniref:uncharacterized protein LOC142368678 n=1 Tax=Odontesthes bonariensis TaxID=219752 RepID=UPI003F58A9A3